MEHLLILLFAASCLLAIVATAILCRFVDQAATIARHRIKLKEIRNNALVESIRQK